MGICSKEIINQNSMSSCRGMKGGRVRIPGLDARSSNIIEGDTVISNLQSLGHFQRGDIAQDELVLSCNNNRIPHSSICIPLQVANHPCRFIYPIRKMLNYLIALVCSFRKIGFQ